MRCWFNMQICQRRCICRPDRLNQWQWCCDLIVTALLRRSDVSPFRARTHSSCWTYVCEGSSALCLYIPKEGGGVCSINLCTLTSEECDRNKPNVSAALPHCATGEPKIGSFLWGVLSPERLSLFILVSCSSGMRVASTERSHKQMINQRGTFVYSNN